jgi:membrane fusion protein YbhG
MKRRTIIIIILLAFIATGIGVAFYYIFRSKNHPNELILYGNVDVRQVDIGFRVSGQVEKLYYEEGDQVARGTLLTVLDKTPYNSEVEQAMANLDSVRFNLENAEMTYRRRAELLPIGGVSQEDYDTAKTQRDMLIANLVAAEAALKIALDNLSYTEAYAPSDAIVLTRIREPGSVVNQADPVYTLSICSPVWIRAFIAEPNLGDIAYGMDAEVYTDSKQCYRGKIGFISPVAEFTPKTVETTQLRTDLVYRLRIYVDNPDWALKQGMPVTVKLKIKNRQKWRRNCE